MPGYVLAPGQPNSIIERNREPQVVLIVNQADAWVFIGQDDVTGRVGRAIVGDQKLEVGKRLVEDALNGFRQVGLVIVDAHNNADLGPPYLSWHSGTCFNPTDLPSRAASSKGQSFGNRLSDIPNFGQGPL